MKIGHAFNFNYLIVVIYDMRITWHNQLMAFPLWLYKTHKFSEMKLHQKIGLLIYSVLPSICYTLSQKGLTYNLRTAPTNLRFKVFQNLLSQWSHYSMVATVAIPQNTNVLECQCACMCLNAKHFWDVWTLSSNTETSVWVLKGKITPVYSQLLISKRSCALTAKAVWSGGQNSIFILWHASVIFNCGHTRATPFCQTNRPLNLIVVSLVFNLSVFFVGC